jgi:AraC-like DNA-binding protein
MGRPRFLQDVRMTYRESLPSAALQGMVAAYWSIDTEAAAPAAPHRILPDGCADLICDFADGTPRMRWVGTMTRAIDVQLAGRQDLFGIRFAPGGLFPLLGAPLSVLTDCSVDAIDLPAKAWRAPLDEWQRDRSFAARVHRANASLQAVLPRRPQNPTAQLLRRLQARRLPPSSAAALASELGVGMRTLQRRFIEHVGVSPKQHLRYLRFERARQLLLLRDRRSIDIAMTAGYSDQAHFVREFRRFTGTTPGRWR